MTGNRCTHYQPQSYFAQLSLLPGASSLPRPCPSRLPAPKGCSRPAVVLPPPPAIPGLAFPLESLGVLISEIFADKLAADKRADAAFVGNSSGGGGGEGGGGGGGGGGSNGAGDCASGAGGGGRLGKGSKGAASPHRSDLEAAVAGFFLSRWDPQQPSIDTFFPTCILCPSHAQMCAHHLVAAALSPSQPTNARAYLTATSLHSSCGLYLSAPFPLPHPCELGSAPAPWQTPMPRRSSSRCAATRRAHAARCSSAACWACWAMAQAAVAAAVGLTAAAGAAAAAAAALAAQPPAPAPTVRQRAQPRMCWCTTGHGCRQSADRCALKPPRAAAR
jgi:hypothetical protein